MKNKLISQKTRSRASKVVLALFLCTIMISSLCSFTVGDTFVFTETPIDYDYQIYSLEEGEDLPDFCERVYNYGHFDFGFGPVTFSLSVPFLLGGDIVFAGPYEDNGVVLGYTYLRYVDLYPDAAGYDLSLLSYTDNEYTINYLNVLIPPPPTPTESLTNVWDGILNWITTSISSLQNVFWQEGTVIDFNSDVDTSDAITINDTVLYKSNVTALITDINLYIDGQFVHPDLLDRDQIDIGDKHYYYYYSGGVILCGFDSTSLVVYTNTDVDYYLIDTSSSGLTLLGTLCCIAVAISVVFLLIGTIVNFLKLRS